ncbi:MAG: Rpn family recombination-promoting nuclease/putative transposase [Planctomycetia bacterium]|nr:Rpn family recombination-promoting nuclease/putative transposase [Planctomycetia bacterium]
MPLGIRPTNDFAFKKTFGSPENKQALMSLLNAILELPSPIVDVTIENPYSQQDFQDDKLSILDVKALDQSGSIYNIEMQLTVHHGLVQRIVFSFHSNRFNSRRRHFHASPTSPRTRPCTTLEKRPFATSNGL